MTSRRDLPPLIALAALFLFTIALQIHFTYRALDTQLHVTERTRVPFYLGAPGGKLVKPQPEAISAGLKAGDTPTIIDGASLRGMGPLMETVRGDQVGDAFHVEVLRDGHPISATIQLAAAADKPMAVRDWILAAFLDYITPWFCILLGFAVAFLRPRDLLAWLLLMLMLSFKEIAQGDSFMAALLGGPAWLRPFAVFNHGVWNGAWPLAMMLFGQYFPDRKPAEGWNRLALYVMGWPLAATVLVNAFAEVAHAEDAMALPGLTGFLNRIGIPLVILTMTAVSTFFINISMKMARAKTRDDKRRLKLLYGGTTASLTPLFLLVIVSLIFKQSMEHVTDWIIVPVLSLLFLFPLTLAYVIVVEKAMELRVVIRQGLQYWLARRGLRAPDGGSGDPPFHPGVSDYVRAGHAASAAVGGAGGDCRDCGAAAEGRRMAARLGGPPLFP